MFYGKLNPFKFKILRLKTQHFHTKLPCQRPMLRQTEQGLQNERGHKEQEFGPNYFFFLKIGFDYKGLL